MGLISSWLDEMGEMWHRMAAGDPLAFMGLPAHSTGTGHGGTGHGGTGHRGTGDGGPPTSMTAHQRQMLNRFFHQQYGRYPVSDYEFQQWLRDHW